MKLHSNIYGWEYVWQEFATEKGGETIMGDDSQIAALRIPMKEHGSTMLVVPTSQGTAVIAHFRKGKAIKFAMHLFVERLIHRIEKAFGLQDLKLGDPSFDNRFIIQSNSPEILAHIFGDAALRQAILAEGVTELSIIPGDAKIDYRWEIPAGHDVIIYCVDALIDKYDHLNASYQVLSALLNQLKSAGVVGNQSETLSAPAVQKKGKLNSPLLGR
jgi:hypothetical protein